MHKSNIHVLARAIIIDQDQILLCRKLDYTPKHYFLPGGHIEVGESAKEAVVRELMEESGFEFKIRRFLGCFEYSFQPDTNDNICHTHEYNFLFEIDKGQSQIAIPQLEDHIQLEWVPLQSLHSIIFRPAPLKILIPEWLVHDLDAAFQSKIENNKLL